MRKRPNFDYAFVDISQIDERGRGAKMPRDIEGACIYRLIIAIFERAISDRAFLDELGVDFQQISGKRSISRAELDKFCRDDWCQFLMSFVSLSPACISNAKREGVARARAIQRGECSRKPRRSYEYKGESHTISEWVDITGMTEGAIRERWAHHGRIGHEYWLDPDIRRYAKNARRRI